MTKRLLFPQVTGFLTLCAAMPCAALLSACSEEPIDEAAVTARVAQHVEAMVKTTGRGVGFAVASDSTLSGAMGGTGTSVNSVTAPMATTATTATTAIAAMPSSMRRAVMGRRLAQKMAFAPTLPSMMTPEEQFDDVAADLRKQMDERLFVPSNLESKSGDTAVYFLRPDPTCRPLATDADPPGTVPAVNEDCASDLTKVAVRLVVREDGDGARVAVLIGPNRFELLVVVVHSDLLAVEVDLAKAKAAADHIQAQLGEDAPMDQFARLAGKIRVSAQKLGEQRVTLALSLPQAIDIATAPGSGDPVDIKSAAADPVVSLTGDGASKTATVVLGLGQTDVLGTWDPMETGVKNRDMHVSLGGYYGRFEIDDNAKKVVITDGGVGQTKLLVREMPIMTFDLNPASNRRFSGTVVTNPDDTSRIEIRPELDLRIAFDYAQIANELGTPPDAALLHDTYGVKLAPGGTSAIVDGVNATDTFSGGIRVIAGTLTFSAASAPAETVVVPQGRCLTTVDTPPANAHPFLGKLTVADCPATR